MIAQWDSSLSVLPVVRVQFPAMAEYFKEFFPGWSHSANPSLASVAENGSISPQRHHTTCGQRGGRPMFNNGQMMGDRKKTITKLFTSSLKFPWHNSISHASILTRSWMKHKFKYSTIDSVHWLWPFIWDYHKELCRRPLLCIESSASGFLLLRKLTITCIAFDNFSWEPNYSFKHCFVMPEEEIYQNQMTISDW